jgi:N-acetylglucosaminyldiphosphoundecaprenol N-acetyl-beta-D-mannosaminyltransferase
MRHRVNLLDIWIDRVTLVTAAEQIAGFVQSGMPHQVVTANVDFIRLGQERPAFRDLVNSADLVVPDGMPLVWASRLQGDPLPERTTGVELMHECARIARGQDRGIFLLGAGPGVADEAAMVLTARYPGLRIAGSFSPTPEMLLQDNESLVRMIREARPAILLVAFGAPKQDEWIRANLHALQVPVCIGVGGAFDMLAGRVKRAPIWMQRAGLEWLFRLFQEPQRLWKRYLIHDLPVFVRLMMQSRRPAAAEAPVPGRVPETLMTYERMRVSSLEPYIIEESGTHIA